jgi:ribonuclease J
MATRTHPSIKLIPGDTIIFSSKIIPGNDKKIFRLFNEFVNSGIEVLTEKDHFVHVSGHPGKQDLQKMYELVRPSAVIPVHGELMHMHEHAKLAKEWGIKNAVQVRNGDVVHISKAGSSKIGQVKSGYLAVDGSTLLPIDSNVIKMRRKMAVAGIIIVTLIMKSRMHLTSEPIIFAPGCLDSQLDKEMINLLREELIEVIESSVHNSKRPNALSIDEIIKLVRSTVKRIVKSELGKVPMIEVHIERL